MRAFEIKPLVWAVAMGMSALTQVANGQDDKVLEEIVVTASYAESLARALDVKRESTGLVDSIMAEDIADFPDQNLAESLQRIPGVAISRDDGEGREITVRGLNSTYTRVQINGMQAQSLAAGSSGVRTDRTFDFNVFASELFNRLDVYKTTSAELEEGSLGATVSLQTARPLDYDEFTLVGNLQESYNEQSGEWAPRVSGLWSITNEESTLGFLISAAYSEKNNSTEGAETVRWEDDNFLCSSCSADELAAVRSAWHPRIPRYADKTNEQTRLGLTSSFQWQPSDNTLLSVDALYANVDVTRNEPYLGAVSLARSNGDFGVREMDVVDYTIDANGTMVAAVVENADVRSENFRAEWDSEYTQFSAALEHEFSDRLRGSVQVGATKSVLNNRERTVIYEHYSDGDESRNVTYPDTGDSISWDYSDMGSPVIDYGFDLTNPANWELSEYRDRLYDASSDTSNLRLDLEYDLSDSLTLKVGATQKSYGYEIRGLRADSSFGAADASDGVVDDVACGIDPVVTAADGGLVTAGKETFFMGGFNRSGELLASGCWVYGVRAGDTREVEEDSLGYFVQLDLDTEVFGNRLRGNLGVRRVGTDLTTRGVTAVEGVETAVTVKHDYDDTLPALTLAYNLTEELVVRAAAAKVMSRPDLTFLNPGGAVDIFGEPRVRYGNPFIEPYRADAYDLSAEWYFTESALLGLALFKKDIESFPTTEETNILWSETGLPDSLLGSQVEQLRDAVFRVSRRVNGGGGLVRGWELQYQQQLTFLPGPDWVRGFGVQANYTKVHSEELDNGRPFLDQSDNSYNLTFYWENESFQARISKACRSEFYTSIDSSESPEQARARSRLVAPSNHIDLSASYKVTDNLKVNIEAINIGDEPRLEYMDKDAKRYISEAFTGAQYFLGVSYSY